MRTHRDRDRRSGAGSRTMLNRALPLAQGEDEHRAPRGADHEPALVARGGEGEGTVPARGEVEALELGDLLAGGEVPEPDAAVVAGRDGPRPSLEEGAGAHGPGV